MRPSFALILAALTPLVTACSSSSTSPNDTPDATPKDSMAPADAGRGHDAAPAPDATTADAAGDTGTFDAGEDTPPQPVFSMDAGTTWTDLYRDYFGNDTATHTAGCSNGSFCHSDMNSNGYQSSGFLCPPGDKTGCYTSLTMQGAMGPELVTADAGYAADDLSSVLCTVDDAGQPTGDGVMPYNCVYNFTPVDVARIQAWIAAGYPDN